MHRIFPNQVSLDPDEVWRVNRAQLALRLNKLPSEIDAMPASDYDDLMELIWCENQK